MDAILNYTFLPHIWNVYPSFFQSPMRPLHGSRVKIRGHMIAHRTPLSPRTIRHQGMSGEQLSVVTSRILYALPAWGGFLSAELTHKINALFRRLKRFGYTTCNNTVSDLIDTSGRDLFRKLCSSEHSLHHLLPPERKCIAKAWSSL